MAGLSWTTIEKGALSAHHRPVPLAPLRRRSTALTVVLTLLAALNSQAEYLLRNWTTADGLPENSVRAVLETRDGYLWMGTANGLARFDGVRFTSFDAANSPGLVSANIFGLFEDPQGGLWLTTTRGVLRYFEGRFNAMPRSQDGVRDPLSQFLTDAKGELWMRSGAALARWTGNHIESVPMPEGPVDPWRICAAPDGGFWFASANGIWRMRDGRAERVIDGPVPESLAATRDGRLWGVLGERELYSLDQGKWSSVTNFGGERCRTLWTASNGDVWIGAASRNRAFRWRDGRLLEVGPAQGLSGNRAITFTEDREGNVWLGMNGAGLYRLRERRLHVFNQNHGFDNTSLASVVEDATGAVLASIMGWKVYRHSGERFEALALIEKGIPLQFPSALAPARPDGVWVGTFYGPLCRVTGDRVVERIGSDAGTRALLVDRSGDIWRGTRMGGVEHFSGTSVTRYAVSNGLSFNNVYSLAQDRSGAVWAGTEEGLNRIENGGITRFGRTNGLGNEFVTALGVDSRGTLWAGTLGGGLSGWTGARFITITTREGLADDAVQQLIEDDHGHLWIGTRAGLMRVAVDDLHAVLAGRMRYITGKLVGRNEGLVRPDCWTEYQPASLKARDGRLWICTSSGLALLDPRHFTRTAPPPLVHVEEVSVDGLARSDLRPGQSEIVIPPGSERLQIRYTGISTSDPELVRFRHRLEGYDRDWIETGHGRSASYSRVTPGRYRFEVQAVNNDGVWNETSASLALVFAPTIWQTAWFRGAALVGLIALLTTAYRARVTRIERRRAEQEAFSRRLIDSQEEERQRIAAELHDSLGQNLIVIKNRAALALTRMDPSEPAAAMVGDVSDMASATIQEVRAIAQNLRPYQIDQFGLTQAIHSMVRQVADASAIEFKTEIDPIDGVLPAAHEIVVYRIAQECLSNVVKHSQARRATLRVRREAESLRLTVSDDGCGFVQGQTGSSGFGSRNIVERARTMRGEAFIDSKPGEGTRVEVALPIPAPSTGQRPLRIDLPGQTP